RDLHHSTDIKTCVNWIIGQSGNRVMAHAHQSVTQLPDYPITRLPNNPITQFGREEPVVIRILCVDDHRIVREGIASLIDRQADMRVVASAASGEEAIDLFLEHQPDVTLMDLQLGVMD